MPRKIATGPECLANEGKFAMTIVGGSVVTRRDLLSMVFALGGLGVLAGCQDPEVGSVPPATKSRKELTGEDRSGRDPVGKVKTKPK